MSSVLIRGADDAAHAAELLNNSKYRAYVAAVDKALRAFETTNEWADLISALGKLSRVFHSNAKFGDIPKPVTVAKRLSQCLHPALPHGVHLKALETYRQLFDILGPKDLPKLLYLFAVGLFPLMDHCGIKVKKELLDIFEQYLLPLGANLKPALPGFITGVLLGLEEGTEFYDRSFTLLDQVQEGVGAESFFACLWEAVLGSPSVRLPALIYVNAKFDRHKTMDAQTFIMGNRVDHMIAALCAVADDEGSTLVQRNLLDFLCTAFPLNSNYLVQENFVQLLRRCLFVVLRRDMSLNRRLYQWLLNRSGDANVSGIPIGSSDEQLDTSFFQTYALPLIKSAIEQYLMLDTIEVASASAAWDGTKEHQLQFTEVRVCRLLLYLMDRPELGSLILEEALPMLLQCTSRYENRRNAEEMHCADIPSSAAASCEMSRRGSVLSRTSTSFISSAHSSSAHNTRTPSDLGKRLSEIDKTLNLLLNSRDVGFIWNFLQRRFKILMEPEKSTVEVNGCIDSKALALETQQFKKEDQRRKSEELDQFAAMASFCIHTVNLDGHSDIRGKYLPMLLHTVLSTIAERRVTSVESALLLNVIQLSRCILVKINQSATALEAGVATAQQQEANANMSTEETTDSSVVLQHRASPLEFGLAEQQRIEECVEDCERILAQVCEWYCAKRCAERLKIFRAISALQREFADFPLYTAFVIASTFVSAFVMTNRMRSADGGGGYSEWLRGLLNVVLFDAWNRADSSCATFQQNYSPKRSRCYEATPKMCCSSDDFWARADAIDLITYVYVRSVSVAEQHVALQGRKKRSSFEPAATVSASSSTPSKTTTTVLLKPLLCEAELKRMENDGVFVKAAHVVWSCLGDSTKACCHEMAARLLTLLHSRKVSEASSDVEDLIVAHLTSADKLLSGAAARKFRTLWMLNRRTIDKDIYPGVPSKPFNRVVMKLLGILVDDTSGCEKAELKSTVTSWFVDCARHNDLPRILQIPSMPSGMSAVTLLAQGGRNSLHHVCEDLSLGTASLNRKRSSEAVEALENIRISQDLPSWYVELRNRLLQYGETDNSAEVNVEVSPSRAHKRTASGLPIFDDDNESVGTLSLDSVDPSIYEVVQYMVDRVCEEENDKWADRSMNTEGNMQHHNAFTSSRTTNVISDDHSCTAPKLSTESTHFEWSSSSLSTKEDRRVLQRPSECSLLEGGETMKRFKSGHRRQGSLQESILTMSAQELKLFDASELPRLPSTETANDDEEDERALCDEIHAHMLLYMESGRVVDLGRAEKLLRMLIALMRSQRSCSAARMIVSCMVSSDIAPVPNSTSSSSSFDQLIDLSSRHVRAILGQEFWLSNEAEGNGSSAGDTNKSKPQTFLELYMNVSLYFLRSYFLNSPTTPVTDSDLRTAWKCKMATLEFLSELVRELISMIRENQSRALVAYVHGILQRSKLQRCLLHSLLASVYNLRASSREKLSLSVDILEFNDGPLAYAEQFDDLIYGYQNSLLDLTALFIQLELDIKNGFQNFTDQNVSGNYAEKPSINNLIYNSPQHRSTLREQHGSLVELCKFILTVRNALKKNLSRHELWHFFIVQILPFLDRSLPKFCTLVAEQLCKNLESVTNTTATVSTTTTSSMMSVLPGISNLVKGLGLFSEATQVSSSAALNKFSERSGRGNWKEAKNEMLNTFPYVLATICDVWTLVRKGKEPSLPIGNDEQIRHLISELLSPIAQHHQQSFLSALALVWLTRNSVASRVESDQLSFDYSEAQLDISKLLLSIEVLPFDNLISTISETLKECSSKSGKPTTPSGDKQGTFPTEVSLLEMLHGCVQATPPASLRNCWPPLQTLINDAPLGNLPPKAIFILFIILADFVRRLGACAIIEDKQMSRAVQDACQRLTDALNVIVGWQLEQTTWLKRTLVVKHDSGPKSQDTSPVEFATAPSSLAASEANSLRGSTTSLVQSRLSAFESVQMTPSTASISSTTLTISTVDKKSSSNLRASIKDTNSVKRDPANSTQALFLLAENLAELIDSICKSEDKERLLPTLHAVWNNTLPYLKAKNARNARFFLASSQFLASMSTFNYMRPVWRKATLDLLLDPARISTTQNSALSSLIISKEVEYEMRAQALKRLAFIVLSSELDQYHAQLPDIQERLSDNLRLSQVPNLHAQVFLCYRVLLLRLKPNHLVSMWPSMVTELVHVLLQIEQQLTGTTSVSDDLKCDRNDHWMQLYLAACKLLETLCTLPSGYLAQFQMCHWAFVNSVAASNTDSFVPFAERIYQLLRSKYGQLTPTERSLMSASLVSVKTLTSFSELRPFFRTLATQNKSLSISGLPNDKDELLRDACYMNGSLSYKNAIKRLEHALYVDFAEHWQL
ncbi:unnamed protein product [Anisakis simplex]|uniref:Dopey_N domain-containing protein n=1 Tax=Anisakis simplex TaxID=6269 RepID=A0A0M3JW73_ANISI|nr:unnamed protein product [Anisakis simplex]